MITIAEAISTNIISGMAMGLIITFSVLLGWLIGLYMGSAE